MLCDCCEGCSEVGGVLDESHHQMVGSNVVEVSGMNEDTFVAQQGQRRLFLVVRQSQRDVETARRQSVTAAGKAVDGNVTGVA